MPRPRTQARGALLLGVVLAASCRGRTTPPADTVDAPAQAPPILVEATVDESEDDAASPTETRPPPRPIAQRSEAEAAVAAGNLEGARDLLTPWVVDHQGDLAAHLLLAAAHRGLGDYAAAESTLDAALAAALAGPPRVDAPARALLLAERARLRRLQSDERGAEALLRQALGAAPNDLALRGELLALLVATGRAAEAEARGLMDALYDAYDAGKAKRAEELLAVAQAALARGTSGAFHDANMVLGEAESAAVAGVEPEHLVRDRILLLRGAVFHDKYAAQDAANTYGLILARDPWHAEALGGLALVHFDELRLADAAQLARRALQVNPRQPAALAALARIAVVEGRHDEARDTVAKGLAAVAPEGDDALAVLGAIAITRGDRPAYEAARDRALARTRTGARFFVTLGELLVSMHLYPEAGEVLAEAAGRGGDDPSVQSAYGLNLLRMGDEVAGRAALARAWKRDRFNARTRNTLDLYDNKIDPLYLDVQRPRLHLRLPREDHEFVEDTLVGAHDRARAALDARYGDLAGTLRLEAFADPQDFSIRTVGVPSLGAVGVCFGRVITLVGPYQGTHNGDQVIWHELAHVYAIKLSRGRVPRWFTEGLSEWESELADPSWARESAELLDAARRQGKLRRLGDLELAFLRAESALGMEVAYATAAYAMRWLGETHGHPAILAILRGYADGGTTEALFERHLGKPFAAIEADFDAWLTGQIAARVQGWTPAAGKAPKDERDRIYQRALVAVRGGDADTAARALQELIQKGGDGYSVRLALAQILAAGPSWQAAEPHLRRARELRREAVEPLVQLAELARRRGDVAGEKALLVDALALDAMSYDPAARLVMLALVTRDEPRLTLARGRAAAIAPLHPLTLAARAIASAAAGDGHRAQALHRRALAVAPDSGPADTLVVMALSAAAIGDKGGAKILAARAGADPKLPAEARAALDALVK